MSTYVTCKAFQMVSVPECANKLAGQPLSALSTNLISTSRLLPRSVLLLRVHWISQGAGGWISFGRGETLGALHIVRVGGLPRETIYARIIGLILRLWLRLLRLRLRLWSVQASQ